MVRNLYFFGCIFGIISALYQISVCYDWKMDAINNTSELSNPALAANTLYNSVLYRDYSSVAPVLFYFLLPFLSMMAYGWSFNSESRSGYIKNILTRTTKLNYFTSKYIAVFISGGLTALIPLVINIIIVGMFVPAVTPNVYYDIYYAISPLFMWADMFYNAPIIYMILTLALNFIFAGLMAAVCLTFSMYLKNRFAVIIIPFLVFILYDYFCDLFLNSFFMCQMSPTQFTHASMWVVYCSPIIITGVILFLSSVLITLIRGIRNDVY